MPVGGLAPDGHGDFFGTTFFGYHGDVGTIFKVSQ
jgi:hypothetical protein